MNIRAAVAADARGIAEVHVRSWQAAYRGQIPDSVLAGLSVDARATTSTAVCDAVRLRE